MRYQLNVLIYDRCRNILLHESRRYAGHSKWQNIRHIKEEQDAARSKLFRSLTCKMRAAIEEAGSSDPTQNVKLAQYIDQAKKANMPASTLNSFLGKVKNPKVNDHVDIVTARGPGGYTLVIHISTSNIIATKMNISNRLKKVQSKMDSSMSGVFEYVSYVIASKDCNLDQATEDAIIIDAEDVEAVNDEDKTYYQFKCKFNQTDKPVSQLKKLGYTQISIEDTCIPHAVVELSEEEMQAADKIKTLLLTIDGVIKVEDNIV